jgi:hypothetical protein
VVSEHYIAIEGGRYRVYWTTDGRDRHYVGPWFSGPAGAASYAALLDGLPPVSPLRPSADGSMFPCVEPSAERRSGRSRRAGT